MTVPASASDQRQEKQERIRSPSFRFIGFLFAQFAVAAGAYYSGVGILPTGLYMLFLFFDFVLFVYIVVALDNEERNAALFIWIGFAILGVLFAVFLFVSSIAACGGC